MAKWPDGPAIDEVQPQKAMKSPCMPTLSEFKEHRVSHFHCGAWCPECIEAFARERAHLASSTEAREFPLASVDYFFLAAQVVLTRAEPK